MSKLPPALRSIHALNKMIMHAVEAKPHQNDDQ